MNGVISFDLIDFGEWNGVAIPAIVILIALNAILLIHMTHRTYFYTNTQITILNTKTMEKDEETQEMPRILANTKTGLCICNTCLFLSYSAIYIAIPLLIFLVCWFVVKIEGN